LQQPYEITIITGAENEDINLTTSVYPNPTSGQIILNSGNAALEDMSYALLDILGKIIFQHPLNKKQTTISMAELANGPYFIKVLNNKKEIKTFKIIKNS
jgi:hypothetical protein